MIKTPLSTVIGGAFWTPEATVIGGNTPTFDQQIQKLFENGEQGFFYDPNDLSTMFQDAAGTVPVTAVGQTIGLALDKSKGLALGNELVTNGDFGTSTTGWSANNATIKVQSGQLKVTATINWDGRAQQIITGLTTGRFYTVTGNFQPISACRVRVNSVVANTACSSGNSYQNFTLVFLATSSSATVALELASSTSWMPQGYFAYFDNISVKELAGNHAYQTTSSMRPLLVASPQRLDYDIADDKLITNLPAQLTGCTVVRSVPNVGTQILTNQTIPATYEDNKDHCGLIVINRALTPNEASAITAELNKRAGV